LSKIDDFSVGPHLPLKKIGGGKVRSPLVSFIWLAVLEQSGRVKLNLSQTARGVQWQCGAVRRTDFAWLKYVISDRGSRGASHTAMSSDE